MRDEHGNITISYSNTGESTTPDQLGMRPMQAKVFANADSRLLLIKAPPASGKSRALMYVALEKLLNKQVKKVIVAVPERAIGASFKSTDLSGFGFHSDWTLNPQFDLCSPGGDAGKVARFFEFFSSESQILVCTHATLRFAAAKHGFGMFNETLVAIDEFHHVSTKEGNQLGAVLGEIIKGTDAHVIAMTGSYFRGDTQAILEPTIEAKFDHVTYNYYEQIEGYKYLSEISLKIVFYSGTYTDSIASVLNEKMRTIIHIPNVNARESTSEKGLERDHILDCIGRNPKYEDETGVWILETESGESVRVADLVDDNPQHRNKLVGYLGTINSADQLHYVIALGMAQEGFDWPFCERALTVGYRSSLTQIVQIIGRTTRDIEGKSRASFVNFVACPSGTQSELVEGTNNIVKAITASLLMEDVLAPPVGFFPGASNKNSVVGFGLDIDGYSPNYSTRVREVLAQGIADVSARVYQDPKLQSAALAGNSAVMINTHLIPKIVREQFPELDESEVSTVADEIIIRVVLRNAARVAANGEQFFEISGRPLSVDELNIDLIKEVNPILEMFEVLSKDLNANVLREIHDAIRSSRIQITEEIAIEMWPKVNEFYMAMGREPKAESLDPYERELADVLLVMRRRSVKS